MIALDALSLTRLLQLASPALPVGAYSYSQGLEAAIECRAVTDANTAQAWIRDILEYSIASFEAPLLWRLSGALARDDFDAFARWNALFHAGRETAELRLETLQMGHAMKVLILELALGNERDTARLRSVGNLTFAAAFSYAAHQMGVDRSAALVAYVWSWLENQVTAAMKAVPLGQNAGQRMLSSLGSELPYIAQRAAELGDDELSNFVPGLALLSSRHETQYSRIFRS
jgi:urease accessory protein